MLRFDPARRPSAAQALQHDWFGGNQYTVPDTRAPERPLKERRAHPSEPRLDEILSSLLGQDAGDGYSESSRALSEQEETGPNLRHASTAIHPMILDETEDLFSGF
jgi:serine/threonine protein kinase